MVNRSRLLALLAVSCVGFGFALWPSLNNQSRTPRALTGRQVSNTLLTAPSKLDLGVLTIGSTTDVALAVKSNSERPVDSIEASASCGCTRLSANRITPDASGSAFVYASVRPDAYDDTVDSIVTFTANTDAAVAQTRLLGSVLPLFRGWPREARAEFLAGQLSLRIEPRYLDVIRSVQVFATGTMNELPSILDHAKGLLIVDKNQPDSCELLIEIKSDRMVRWAGPLVIDSHSLHPPQARKP